MRIGILTFHSQLNYGGVLQCWALQTALAKLGHDVVVIDRWLEPDNWHLTQGYKPMSFLAKMKFFLRRLLEVGDTAWHKRVIRTQKFLDDHLKRTPYHFCEWKDAPKNLGVDAIVVGSDQVWHCGDFGDPRVYLLDDFELTRAGDSGMKSPKIISYAASFGLRALPKTLGENREDLSNIEAEPFYKRGLAKFDAISCREVEGVELCRRLGFAAEHVVDPTQLLQAEDWDVFAKPKSKKQLTVYLLGEDVDASISNLNAFAKRMRCRVKVFVLDRPRTWRWLPMPISLRRAYRWLRGMARRIKYWRVEICEGAGPKEFVQGHAACNWVVTDSFHSLMFATIFGKNVRVLRPQSEFRKQMFARMEEYAAHATGMLLADDLPSALSSFEKGESAMVDSSWISRQRQESLDFLRGTL